MFGNTDVITMATIKSYTDLQQSKKLAEFLPLESADMYYQYVLPKSGKIKHNPKIGNPVNALKWYNKGYTTSGKKPITLDEYCIPCWSLAALLGVLPNNKHITTTLSRGGWKIEPVEYIDKWFCEYEDEDSPSKNFSVSADNPVNACYEVIIKLYELKML